MSRGNDRRTLRYRVVAGRRGIVRHKHKRKVWNLLASYSVWIIGSHGVDIGSKHNVEICTPLESYWDLIIGSHD